MTIGEYLRKLLNEKNLQVKELREMMGINNRTDLYRLFNDYHSEKKTRELVGKLAACVDFTDAELDTMESLMRQERIKPLYRESRKALSLIYGGNSEASSGDKDGAGFVFERCEGAEAVLYIANIDNYSTLLKICGYLDKNPETPVYHYIRLAAGKLFTAYELAMIIILSRYKNYDPVILDDVSYKGICALTKNAGGGCEYSLYGAESVNGERLRIEAPIPRELYEYHLLRQERRRAVSRQVKKPVQQVTDYIELMRDSTVFEKGVTLYSEGAPCFGNIPYDIFREMLADIDYAGFPENHPYVGDLLNLFKTREELPFITPGARKMYLFDEEHIKEMMRTGISFDHAEMVKPMSQNQMRRYFDWLIRMARDRPDKIRFRFLKSGTIDKPYVYGENEMLYMYRSDTGYMNGFSVMMRNKGIFDIMNDFTRYVWENFTMSDGESIAKLGHMMKEYI